MLSDALDRAGSHGRGGLGVPVFWAVANEDNEITVDEVASHLGTVAVGRTNVQDTPARSAWGEKLEFVAPGVEVVSTLPGGRYGIETGTSFAAPCAAGVAALVLSVRPDLRRPALLDILHRSCDPVAGMGGSGARNDLVGFGRPNARRAVALALAAP